MKCGELKLDLGCGGSKEDGFIGLDIIDYSDKYKGEFIQRDLRNESLPFCDNSCVEIRAWHFLEHITGDEMIYLMNECHRVLIKGGIMKVQVPDASRQSTWRPIHLQNFGLCYLDYLGYKATKHNWQIVSKAVVRDDTCFEFVLRTIDES